MHGRPRKATKPEDTAASAAKAAKLRDLQAQLLHQHNHRIYTGEALAASSKLLEINLEIYTAWNYRKLALPHNLNEVTDPEIVKSAVEDELRVVEMALRRNPKSYGAWYHRKWVLSRGLAPVDFEREFRLLDQLLKADARNFHGWNYRRFVAKLKNVSEEEELKFTMDMINTNFSNYSAWHNRSVLLSHLLKQKAQGFDSKEDILTEEYELVRQALFTDPSDQSGWFYHLWLLDQTASPDELFLISSWPVPGSDLVLSTNDKVEDYKLFPTSNFSWCYFFHKRTFPIILYFNQAVKGVSSSTVTINSVFVANENLIWRPLLTTSSSEAHCWVTYLNIPDVNPSNLKAYSVEISLGHSEGIVSSNGSCYPVQFKFTIKLNNNNLEQFDVESIQELFGWNYDDACHPSEIPDINSFDQLKISEDHVAEGSKDKQWHLETLSSEINLFRELSEENCKFVDLTLARLLVAHDAMVSHGAFLMQKRIHSEHVLKLYEELIKLDPWHKRYYEDERSLVLMSQVTSHKEFLMKHTWHFSKSTSSSFHNHACLQLSGLSLSRIGFVEHLLWVQMLDLRHNNLRTIAGALLFPLICLIMTIGNSAIILGLWPAHAIWTYYCIARSKQLGPVLKLVLGTGISVILVLWPLAGISGSILVGAGYGFFAPVLATFDAVGEGKTNEFIHCFLDGTWSTIKGCFTVVRDLNDLCFHSYFSIMDDLRLHDPPDGEPYEIRLQCIPGSFLVGVLGIMIDVPVITIIAICKSPYMLIKGWNRLFHDLMGREGPFLETACVPFAGLAILLWPLAVAGAVAASIMSSFPLGAYAAVVAYQESSVYMGLCYIVASLSMFDEYSNDILDMPEGSCFPRPQYRKRELLHARTFSRPTSLCREKQEGKGPPSRSTSFKNSIRELNPFKLLEHLFSECKRYGDNLVAEGVITSEDIEEARSGKGGSRIVSIGLPAYSILQALLQSGKANADGLVLSDNTLITTDNRPKDRFFDWFFDPLMIIKEQIKAENFSEEEENYLSKVILLLGDSKRLKNLNARSPPLNERRRAEIDAFARRLQGITKSISRYPTAKRRFDDLVRSLSEELEKKMRGSRSVNASPQPQRSRGGINRLFSQKSLGKKASIQGDDQGA